MKILIAGFQHETNTFAPSRADWNSFVEGGGMPSMTHGQDLMDFRGINLPLGGFLDALHGENHEYIPVIWAAASPSAHVTRDAYERITAQIIDALLQNATALLPILSVAPLASSPVTPRRSPVKPALAM